MPIAIFHRDELKEYDFGPGHSFRGERYEIFSRFLKENLTEDDIYRLIEGDWAADEDLSLICEEDYIDFTKKYYSAANSGSPIIGEFSKYHSNDNQPIGRPGKLEEAARLVVGQGKMAAELIQAGEFKKVVSIGGGMHHAKSNYGEGFCIYNDVAFVAKYLTAKYDHERVLILDTDAHAGNGTLNYFYADPRVLFIDLHQDPRTLYPGTGFVGQTGEGEGEGYTINVPMPLYAGYDSYRSIFEKIVFPVVEEFNPQIIIRNGGSDPHFADDLTQLGLTVEGFRMVGRKVRELSKFCDEKVIDLIASGYNKDVLPYAWLALISGLAGFDIQVEEPVTIPRTLKENPPMEGTGEVIEKIRRNLKDYWKSLG